MARERNRNYKFVSTVGMSLYGNSQSPPAEEDDATGCGRTPSFPCPGYTEGTVIVGYRPLTDPTCLEGCPFPSGFSDGSHTRILPASISSDGVTTKVHTILTFQG